VNVTYGLQRIKMPKRRKLPCEYKIQRI